VENLLRETKILFETLRNSLLAATLLIVIKYIKDNPEVAFHSEALIAIESVIIFLLSLGLQLANVACYFYQLQQNNSSAKSKVSYYIGVLFITLILTHLYLASYLVKI